MIKHFIIVLVLFSYSAHGQTDAPLVNMSDSDYVKILNDRPRVDIYYKSNKAAVYYQMHKATDSVFKYIYESVHDHAIEYCWTFKHSLGDYYKSDYPKQVYEICRLCDSINKKNLDSGLINVMVSVKANDQKYRAGIELKEGNNELWNKQHKLDSENQRIIADLMDKKARYIGSDIVGVDFEDVAFMVIQHADLPYQEKYLELIKKAINEGNLYKSCYPLLLDRMYMRRGLAQIFGTQVVWNKKRDCYELYKVQNLEKINELRKAYDLGSLSSYLRGMHAVIPASDKIK